jgi:hypothetical protein
MHGGEWLARCEGWRGGDCRQRLGLVTNLPAPCAGTKPLAVLTLPAGRTPRPCAVTGL